MYVNFFEFVERNEMLRPTCSIPIYISAYPVRCRRHSIADNRQTESKLDILREMGEGYCSSERTSSMKYAAAAALCAAPVV